MSTDNAAAANLEHCGCYLCGDCGEIETTDNEDRNEVVPCPECIALEIAEERIQTKAIRDELVAQLVSSLPFIEDLLQDQAYKDGVVALQIKNMRAALTKAGAI